MTLHKKGNQRAIRNTTTTNETLCLWARGGARKTQNKSNLYPPFTA